MTANFPIKQTFRIFLLNLNNDNSECIYLGVHCNPFSSEYLLIKKDLAGAFPETSFHIQLVGRYASFNPCKLYQFQSTSVANPYNVTYITDVGLLLTLLPADTASMASNAGFILLFHLFSPAWFIFYKKGFVYSTFQSSAAVKKFAAH